MCFLWGFGGRETEGSSRVTHTLAMLVLKEPTYVTYHQSSRILISQATSPRDEAIHSKVSSASSISTKVRKWSPKDVNFLAVPSPLTGNSTPAEFTVLNSGEKSTSKELMTQIV